MTVLKTAKAALLSGFVRVSKPDDLSPEQVLLRPARAAFSPATYPKVPSVEGQTFFPSYQMQIAALRDCITSPDGQIDTPKARELRNHLIETMVQKEPNWYVEYLRAEILLASSSLLSPHGSEREATVNRLLELAEHYGVTPKSFADYQAEQEVLRTAVRQDDRADCLSGNDRSPHIKSLVLRPPACNMQ